MPGATTARSWTGVVAAVVSRPRLWATAVGQVFRLSPTGWWRHAPFIPRPDPAYVRFRVSTQYGGGGETSAAEAGEAPAPAPRDVVEYLEWCRTLRTGRVGRPTRR